MVNVGSILKMFEKTEEVKQSFRYRRRNHTKHQAVIDFKTMCSRRKNKTKREKMQIF
jgi:hypothetical protein